VVVVVERGGGGARFEEGRRAEKGIRAYKTCKKGVWGIIEYIEGIL
jgi:hypothetical protein